MALFQPTNIIPSSFTVGVVDATKDVAQVSWQVNGNSALTAFQIDYYDNEANDDKVIATTGKQTVAGGFYGTDRFGQPQIYTWTAVGNSTWSAYNSKFINGNQYKFKITQYWQEGKEEKFIAQIESSVFITRDTPNISIQRSENEDFSTPVAFPNGTALPSSIGYFVGVYSQAQGAPVREARWQVATWGSGEAGEILADTGDIDTPTLQFEFNGFFIGNQYAVRCSGKADYQTYGTQDFDSGWTYFTAQLPEAQGSYTGNFTVEYLSKEKASLLRWESINVIPGKPSPSSFVPIANDGAVVLPKRDAMGEYKISWDKENDSPMSFAAPWTAAWGGDVSAEILEKTKILFGSDSPTEAVQCAALSPDKTFLVIGTGNEQGEAGRAALFRVNDSQVTFISEIPTSFLVNGGVYSAAFSRNGNLLVLGGSFLRKAVLFRVKKSSPYIEYVADITKEGTTLDGGVMGAYFSPTNDILVLCGSFTGRAAIFVTSTQTPEYRSDIKGPLGESLERGIVDQSDAAFSPNGRFFALGSSFDDAGRGALLFEVEGDSFRYVQTLDLLDTSGRPVGRPAIGQGYAHAISFNPTGDIIVFSYNYTFLPDATWFLCYYQLNDDGYTETKGVIEYFLKYYSNQRYTSSAFSPDGKLLVVGRRADYDTFSTFPTLIFFSVKKNFSGAEFSRVEASKIFQPASAYISPIVSTVVFLPNGVDLFVGGEFKDFAEIDRLRFISPHGNIMKIALENGTMLSVQGDDEKFQVLLDGNVLGNIQRVWGTNRASIIITPKNLWVFSYKTNSVSSLIFEDSVPLNFEQRTISSVEILGGTEGATVRSVSIYKGSGENVLFFYDDPNFKPKWNDENYALFMAANFNGAIDGGTGNSNGIGFRVYRREIGKELLLPIATLPPTATQLKDYGIRSRKAYLYSLYAYNVDGAFMKSEENDTVVSTCFNSYSLLVCDYDSENDAYHVRKQYIFALNLSEGSVGNNNSPTLNANFTAYPTRMPSTQNYASGTLQGLIGAIYTVPALIEQIGGFKHTAKPSTLDYFDSVDLEKELYELSTAPYQLFLRDMKGHLRMVATSGAITMTQDLKKRQLSTSISLPWVEIGDASDVTIIQTPDDYGWNNDEQDLDVKLDVDPLSGILSATYPRPYDGTKFYLTGAQKEILAAETPAGITPAQFALSPTAEEPDDGILSATANVASEDEEGD